MKPYYIHNKVLLIEQIIYQNSVVYSTDSSTLILTKYLDYNFFWKRQALHHKVHILWFWKGLNEDTISQLCKFNPARIDEVQLAMNTPESQSANINGRFLKETKFIHLQNEVFCLCLSIIYILIVPLYKSSYQSLQKFLFCFFYNVILRVNYQLNISSNIWKNTC